MAPHDSTLDITMDLTTGHDELVPTSHLAARLLSRTVGARGLSTTCHE